MAMVDGLTIAWAVAFVVMLVLHGPLSSSGRGWWVWTGAAGIVLGFFGMWYCRRRRAAILRHRAALDAEAAAGPTAGPTAEPAAESEAGASPTAPGDDPDATPTNTAKAP
ncbi:hypothetical protein BIV57_17440 [Mangrovactinospora gilvigrisea]|uniref:DUF2530 domain-containing protein n=1 Tax=Mangrovactinospora gilvigrisea TaxID=1428644 RepID=A0A1J7BBZ4_9ACTN|nr:hypothetical protein BIV57_17440 [Mangrovactinospora gilvigrisea]